MNRRLIVILIIIGLLLISRTDQAEQAFTGGDLLFKIQSLFEPNVAAKAAIVIDEKTGKVLYAKNADTTYPVASMSKMMTEYLLLEAVKEKRASWSDMVPISPNAEKAEGARVHLVAGQTYPLKDLYYAMAVGSANNAAVAIGEYLAGSTTAFAKLMNQKAVQMKLRSTHFVNATGLDDLYGQNQMSARDVSILARHLITDFPEIISLSKQPSVTLSSTGEAVANTNEMIASENERMLVEGLDGLKTGFTDQSGYCFTGTAEQGGKRLISVVMGAETKTDRFTETKTLMDVGFTTW
ncbi:MAG: D-alanyl-D-alanine carboxypeptidase family protein [Clostridia bacterium]